MAAWEEDFDEMVEDIQAAERARLAALPPRERFRELLRAEATRREGVRRGSNPYANLNAANRTRRARILANYISRNPNYRSIGALRTTSKVPMARLPENAVNTIRSMLYGPRRRGEGAVANIHMRKIRAKKVANATRRHFPANLNELRPRVRRTQSLNHKRSQTRRQSQSRRSL